LKKLRYADFSNNKIDFFPSRIGLLVHKENGTFRK
jgi:hypothetical protein